MNTAKEYFQKQLANDEFKRSYLEEKVKLDLEYQLEELKNDIQTCKPIKDILKKVDSIEQYVTTA